MAAQRALNVVRLTYPQPLDSYSDPFALRGIGIRVGIIARDHSDDAWRVARHRFPPHPRGEQAHDVAALATDSEWYTAMSTEARRPRDAHDPFWLHPFRIAREFCPYLVGSYDRVADELAGYMRLGARTIILDIPPSREELGHIDVVFRRARELEPAA